MDFNIKKIVETIKSYPHLKNFKYIGFIGSLDLKHDIDIVLIPNKEVIGEFIIDSIDLIKYVKKVCEKKNIHLVAVPHLYNIDEADYFSKNKDKVKVLLHVISNFFILPKNFFKSIKNKFDIYGQPHNYSIKRKFTGNKKVSYNNIINFNLLNADYPLKLLVKKVETVRRYANKFLNMNLDEKPIKKYIDCEDAYFEILRNLK